MNSICEQKTNGSDIIQKVINILQRYILPNIILFGVLLVLGRWCSTWILFIALVPMFNILENTHYSKIWKIGGAYLCNLMFTMIIIYWFLEVYDSIFFSIATFLSIAFFLTLPYVILFILSSSGKKGFLILCMSLVIANEFMILHGDSFSPAQVWGNFFVKDIKLAQFYKYTGTLGGTFWLFATNILFYP